MCKTCPWKKSGKLQEKPCLGRNIKVQFGISTFVKTIKDNKYKEFLTIYSVPKRDGFVSRISIKRIFAPNSFNLHTKL